MPILVFKLLNIWICVDAVLLNEIKYIIFGYFWFSSHGHQDVLHIRILLVIILFAYDWESTIDPLRILTNCKLFHF